MKDITLIALKDALVGETVYAKSGDYDIPLKSLSTQLNNAGVSFDIINDA